MRDLHSLRDERSKNLPNSFGVYWVFVPDATMLSAGASAKEMSVLSCRWRSLVSPGEIFLASTVIGLTRA